MRRPKHKPVKKTKANLSLKEEEWGVLLRIESLKRKKYSVQWPLKQNQTRLQWSKVKRRNARFKKDPLAARVAKTLLVHLHHRPGALHQPSLGRHTTKRRMNIGFLTKRGELMSPRRKQWMRKRKREWRTQKKAAKRNVVPLH